MVKKLPRGFSERGLMAQRAEGWSKVGKDTQPHGHPRFRGRVLLSARSNVAASRTILRRKSGFQAGTMI